MEGRVESFSFLRTQAQKPLKKKKKKSAPIKINMTKHKQDQKIKG